ncbi:hypothetical protein [Virgisporangium aurantiacum]|uniref:hypothetical protein n=1 Tax=Virgisporangium aurantiacum TaxID=175570 RepID=UPI0019526CF8|nr:hypothetical protein [Virgisporangium aurantiacum]
MCLVPPPTRGRRIVVADQIDLVPPLRVAQIVIQDRSTTWPLRQAHRQDQVPIADTGQDDGQRSVMVPPRPHRQPRRSSGPHGRHPPGLPQSIIAGSATTAGRNAVPEGGQVAVQRADQPK